MGMLLLLRVFFFKDNRDSVWFGLCYYRNKNLKKKNKTNKGVERIETS